MASRTRPRLEIEHLHIPPPLNENQDLNIHTDLRIYSNFQPSTPAPEPPQPPPPFPNPPENQDFNVKEERRKEERRTCLYFQTSTPAPEQPPPQPEPVAVAVAVAPAPPARRQRRNPTHAPRAGKPTTIQPPFLWATDRRAQVHSLKYLTDIGITTISGDVQCKRCEQRYQIEYNLQEKFKEVADYVAENKYSLRERAPPVWMNPPLSKCKFCNQENSAKPKTAEKKRSVNWLFLLLGQMLGCCTLDQLKYFCKHTGCHRTGAKDRVLFLTYLELCKQVNPDGPFNRCQPLSVLQS